jgi:hypothetical protein
MSYGAFFAFAMLLNAKPRLLPESGHIGVSGDRISAKTALLPFLCCVFVSFAVFTVFRDESVGTDYYSYKIRCFDNAAGAALADYMLSVTSAGFEPLFALFSYLIKNAGGNFLVFLFIFYVIVFLTQVTLFSKVNGFFIPLVLYLILVFPMILDSFSMMRNSLAAFIAIWGYVYLSKKKYFAALSVFLAAALIHYTAMFCFSVWLMCLFCDRKRFHIRRAVILVVLGATLCYALLPALIKAALFLNPLYIYKFEDQGISIKTMFFYVAVFTASVVYSRKFITDNPVNRVMLIAVGCAIATIPLQGAVELISRMLLFSHIPLFFLIAGLFSVKITRNNVIPMVCVLSLIMLLSLARFYVRVTSIAVDYGINNYGNMLFKIF